MSTYEIIEQWVKVVVALFVVLLLIYGSIRFGKKYTRIIGRKRYIQVLDTIPIYNKSAITIVKVGNKHMIIGVSENNTQLITQLSDEDIKQMEKENILQQEQADRLKGLLNLRRLRNKAE